MRLGNYVRSLTLVELEETKEQLNLTDEEQIIITCLAKGKSNLQIADICNCSLATIGNRISDINHKLNKLKGGVR